MTKEELLKRAEEVIEYYYTIQGRGNWLKNDYNTSGCNMLRIEDLENNENILNFLVDLVNIMKKYNIDYSGVNGMLCNFKTKDGDNDIRIGVSNLWFFLLTQEEMDKNIEKAKEYAYQKMLNNRVKFLLPDNLKYKQSEDEYYFEGKPDECDCEDEDDDIESHKFHEEFMADIETLVELNHIETFTDKNDIKNKICEKIANTINQSTFYHINVKDIANLEDKIQLKETETDSTINDIKTYSVSIKGVLFEYMEYYNGESYDATKYSLNKSIIRLCERTNMVNDINITNIEIIDEE